MDGPKKDAIDVLEQLVTGHDETRRTIVRDIRRGVYSREEVQERLREYLDLESTRQSPWGGRAWAISGIGATGIDDGAAIETLQYFTTSEEPAPLVRFFALIALYEVGATITARRAAELSKSEEPQVAYVALAILAALGDAEALRKVSDGLEDLVEQADVLYALQYVAVPELRAALRQLDVPTKKASHYRDEALERLDERRGTATMVWLATDEYVNANSIGPLMGVNRDSARHVWPGDLVLELHRQRSQVLQVAKVRDCNYEGDVVHVELGETAHLLDQTLLESELQNVAPGLEYFQTRAAFSPIPQDAWDRVFPYVDDGSPGHFVLEQWPQQDQTRTARLGRPDWAVAEFEYDAVHIPSVELSNTGTLSLEQDSGQLMIQPRLGGDLVDVQVEFHGNAAIRPGETVYPSLTFVDGFPAGIHEIEWGLRHREWGELNAGTRPRSTIQVGSEEVVDLTEPSESTREAPMMAPDVRSDAIENVEIGETVANGEEGLVATETNDDGLERYGPAERSVTVQEDGQGGSGGVSQIAKHSQGTWADGDVPADVPTGQGPIGEALPAHVVPAVVEPVAAPVEVSDLLAPRGAVATTMQSVFNGPVTVALSTTPPPDPADTLRLTISNETATAEFGDQKHRSPMNWPGALSNEQSYPEKLGRQVFDAVFNNQDTMDDLGATLPLFDAARRKTNRRLAIELDLVGDADLHAIPWEYMRPPDGEALALSEYAPFARRSISGQDPLEPKPGPMRVLVVIANPEAVGEDDPENPLRYEQPLPVDEYLDVVREALEPHRESGHVEYEVLAPGPNNASPTAADIAKAMRRDGGVDVLHLVAHGIVDSTNGEDHFLLGIDSGDGEPVVSSSELKVPASVRLAVLTACSGFEPQAVRDRAGIGNELVKQGCPAVVSMRGAVPVVTAQRLLGSLYHELVRTGNIASAMAATRYELSTDGTTSTVLGVERATWRGAWGIPVLHLGGATTGQLFERDEDRVQTMQDFVAPVLPLVEAVDASVDVAGIAEVLSQVDTSDPRAVEQVARQVSEAVRPSVSDLQDRRRISDLVIGAVRINAEDLGAAIAERGIELPAAVYGQIATALNVGQHIALIGPPGTGKTTVAQAICDYAASASLSAGSSLITGSADWTTFDTVGGYAPNPDGTLTFRPGLVLQSIADGHWLALDELNRADIDKAIGELFTVLAGQDVELPYLHGDEPVRILAAPSEATTSNWFYRSAVGRADCVVHPNWRVIATMNVYDKSSLFAMSQAFMRRMAFIDVGGPEPAVQRNLTRQWLQTTWIAADEQPLQLEETRVEELAAVVDRLADQQSVLGEIRPLGPAIINDMCRFVVDREMRRAERLAAEQVIGEALLLYGVPQFEGLARAAIVDLHHELVELVGNEMGETISKRIRDIYPHIPADAWAAAPSPDPQNG